MTFQPSPTTIPTISTGLGSSRLPRVETRELTRLVDAFCQLQYHAYTERMRLHPNGEALMSAFEARASKTESDQMRRVIGRELLEAVLSIGRDPLKLLRAFGAEVIAARSLLPASLQEFNQRLICGVQSGDGGALALSPDVVKSVGAAIHDSWIRAVIYCSPDPTRHRAVATGDAQHMLKLFQSLDALHPSLQNNDMLGALMLCKHMARLAEGEFQCLLSLAPQGNPRNLTLTMARGAAGSNIPISVAHEASPAWLHMSRTNSRFDGWPLLDAHTSERSAQLDLAAIDAHASLVAEERNDLLPEMFRSEQFASKEGIQVLRELLGRVRENRLGLIQTARRLLGVEPHGPVEIPVSSIKPFEWPALGNELSKIEIAERWRTYHESKRLATALPSAPTAPSLQLIKAERFPLFESSVQRLIETRMVPAQQEGLEAGRTSGGILNNYYDSEFWRTFFASGGTLVARLDPRTAELLGFMAYAAPRVPRHLEGMALHGALPIPAYVSHAELAVVAHNAPPQTLDTLLHAMLLDLVIQGAEASRGVTYTWNQRARSALTRRDHHAFDGEPLVVQSAHGLQAMVPMWWDLKSRA